MGILEPVVVCPGAETWEELPDVARKEFCGFCGSSVAVTVAVSVPCCDWFSEFICVSCGSSCCWGCDGSAGFVAVKKLATV